MLSLFGPKLPIDGEELEFQLATFKWLIGEFGNLSEAALILPTPEYFPSAKSRRRVPARLLFSDVQRAAQLDHWPCELREGDSGRASDAGNAHLIRHEGSHAPCGTFSVEQGKHGYYGVITYDPELENDQQALVATFAHELGHFLMSTAKGTPPGGWELQELHTDLAAVYLGFGIFMANSAWTFSQYQSGTVQGWSSRTQGYLSEVALVTALAIFQRLAGRDPSEAAPYIEDYLRKALRKADAWLAKHHPDLPAAVGAVDLEPYGSTIGESEEGR
jgi:hypothetical protein